MPRRIKQLLWDQGDKVPPQCTVDLPEQHAAHHGSSQAPPPRAMLTVLERSRRLCLSLYERDQYGPETFLDLLQQYQLFHFRPEQIAVFAALAEWRDANARATDESLGFIMPRALITRISQEVPGTRKALQQAIGGSSRFAQDRRGRRPASMCLP